MTTAGPHARDVDITAAPAWLLAQIAGDGPGYVEVRYGPHGRFDRQRFLRAADVARDPEAVVAWTLRLAERFDVAVGLAVRGERSGRAEACIRASVIWADIDGPSVAPLFGLPTPPHLVCESSPGRLHCYWALKEASDLTDADERTRFLASLRRVQRVVGGDPAATDVARILRLPGCLHWGRCTSLDDDPGMVVPVVFRP